MIVAHLKESVLGFVAALTPARASIDLLTVNDFEYSKLEVLVIGFCIARLSDWLLIGAVEYAIQHGQHH